MGLQLRSMDSTFRETFHMSTPPRVLSQPGSASGVRPNGKCVIGCTDASVGD